MIASNRRRTCSRDTTSSPRNARAYGFSANPLILALRLQALLRKPRSRPECKTTDIGIVAEAEVGEHRGRSAYPIKGSALPSVRDRTNTIAPAIARKHHRLQKIGDG